MKCPYCKKTVSCFSQAVFFPAPHPERKRKCPHCAQFFIITGKVAWGLTVSIFACVIGFFLIRPIPVVGYPLWGVITVYLAFITATRLEKTVIPMEEVFTCLKCGLASDRPFSRSKCPDCGHRISGSTQVERLGWWLLGTGFFLSVLMGSITYKFFPILINSGSRVGSSRFEGTPEQGKLILFLFGVIFLFGLACMGTGGWQIKTGIRSRRLMLFSLVIATLITGGAWVILT